MSKVESNSRPAQQIEGSSGVLPIPLEVNFTTNNLVRAVVDEVSSRSPDWKKLSPRITNAQGRLANPESIVGTIAEVHLQETLTELAKRYQGRVITNPIKDGTESEKFTFRRDTRNRFYACDKETGNSTAEYDMITEIDGLPTVWEIKLNPQRSGGEKQNRLRGLLRSNNINQRFHPLRDYYGNNEFAYIIIAAQEAINPSSGLYQDFIKKGGIVIPFPLSTLEFKVRVLEARLRK